MIVEFLGSLSARILDRYNNGNNYFLDSKSCKNNLWYIILMKFFNHPTLKFNEVGFFYFILPPIIFAAGYTLKHRRFVRNLDTIMLLGILGTLITMVILSTILTTANSYIFFESMKIRPTECLVLVSSIRMIMIMIGNGSLRIRYDCSFITITRTQI